MNGSVKLGYQAKSCRTKDNNSSLNWKTSGDGKEVGSPFYPTLAAHQLAEKDWEYYEILTELHRWTEILVDEFTLPVPPVALSIGPTRANCSGYFRPGHNDFGFRREIKIDRDSLFQSVVSGEFWQPVGTLLHELLHAHQDAFGNPPKRSNYNYHNKEFRDKAAVYGLIVNDRGITEYAPQSLFIDLLRKHGVSVPQVLEPASRPAGRSKLKKWSCRCNPSVNVRVAIDDFHAKCLKCQQHFMRSS